MTEEGPKLVELGARMGADCITTYLLDNSISGINMSQIAIQLALGDKPKIGKFQNSGIASAIRFIPAKKGTIKKIEGVKRVERMEGIIKVAIIGQKGKKYMDAVDDTARFGFVVAVGKTPQEALLCCEKAIESISFIMC